MVVGEQGAKPALDMGWFFLFMKGGDTREYSKIFSFFGVCIFL